MIKEGHKTSGIIINCIDIDDYDVKQCFEEKDHIVEFGRSGLLWAYGHDALNARAKKSGAKWDGTKWNFSAGVDAQQFFLAGLREKHPDWPVFSEYQPFTAIKCALVHYGQLSAIFFPTPLFAPGRSATEIVTLTQREGIRRLLIATTAGKKKQKKWLCLIGGSEVVGEVSTELGVMGARVTEKLIGMPALHADGAVHVATNGWAVKLTADIADIRQLYLAPIQRPEWSGKWPNSKRVLHKWAGEIDTTRRRWPDWQQKLADQEIAWYGDDPAVEETPLPKNWNTELAPGWTSPTADGRQFLPFQRDGIEFCARRQMRALIGDEMGTGKTAQAIGAAEAARASSVLIICPAVARGVWQREIMAWGRGGKIQHIRSRLDAPEPDSRWLIVTYDLLPVRPETWTVATTADEEALRGLKDAGLTGQLGKQNKYPKKITLDRHFPQPPRFTEARSAKKWAAVMSRLAGGLMAALEGQGFDLLIVDEAHRAKNSNAKRSSAICALAAQIPALLMLTGTPIRNNIAEAAVLLGYLDATAGEVLDEDKGYSMDDIAEYLEHFMIRRTKAEVLPQLPTKIRQRIDIDELDAGAMCLYHAAMSSARQAYRDALKDGASEADARHRMGAGLAIARKHLGLAKVSGGQVLDLVLDVLENKECVVVFCAHHAVTDTLAAQLGDAGKRVGVIDGRSPVSARAEIAAAFQEGKLDVLIGGINSAGEALTLSRADTVVFVELDWVPAAMLQAEDRIHRVGQQARSCQIIHIIAAASGNVLLDEIVVGIIAEKLNTINAVLGENSRVVSSHTELLEAILKQDTEQSDAEFGCKKDGTPRLQAPGPGRPRLSDGERKERRAISKRIYRQKNIEKQRAYHKKWLASNKDDSFAS